MILIQQIFFKKKKKIEMKQKLMNFSTRWKWKFYKFIWRENNGKKKTYRTTTLSAEQIKCIKFCAITLNRLLTKIKKK